MRTSKFRAIAAVAAAACLSATAIPGMASAAALQQRGASPQVQPIQSTAGYTALDAGSAGIPGYDDAECEGLAHDYNTARQYQDEYNAEGNTAGSRMYGLLAQSIFNQMTDNCLVVGSS